MLRKRVIPVLLLKDGGLYKSIRFKHRAATYVGDPINCIKVFNDKEVDELIFLDIMASKQNSEPDYELLKNIASECFMPIAYGGGIKNLEQVRKIIGLGIEKIVLNSVLLKDYNLIEEIAKVFGSQSIVASVDVKKSFFGGYKIYDSSKNRISKQNLLEHLDNLQRSGVGEIIITSVNREGTFSGYDLDLISFINKRIKVPMIINGGASNLDDFKKAFFDFNLPAAAASSIFVFKGRLRGVLISYPKYQEIMK